MKRTIIAAAAIGLGLAVGGAAFAQSGQIGPAKTPNGSMPAAPSNSTPSSGSKSGSPIPGGSAQNDGGGQAMPGTMAPAKRMVRHRRARKHRSM